MAARVCSRCWVWQDEDAFYPLPNGRLRTVCKICTRKTEAERQRVRRRGGTPEPKPKPPELPNDSRVSITNSCGHTYRYTIKRPQAVRWLETQPCPKCRKREGGDGSGQNHGDGSGSDNGNETPTPNEDAPEDAPDTSDGSGGEDQGQTQTESERAKRDADPTWVKAIPLPNAVFHIVLPDIIRATRANVPAWLQGPPGTSKSTIARQVADALGLGFYPIACHEMMTRSDLFGFTDANGIDHRTPLWNAYEHGGVCLLDEVDNGNPNLLAALNSALSNGHCVFGSGTVIERHSDFRVIATANTAGLGPEHGFIGRNGVDLATRDRFATFMVPIDDALEAALASMAMGHNVDVTPFAKRARRRLLASSRNIAPSPEAILDNVRRARKVVDERYRGTIVSPRATIHVGALISERFTLDEAMTTKLPGLDVSDVVMVLKEANGR